MDEINKTEEKKINYLVALIGETGVGKTHFFKIIKNEKYFSKSFCNIEVEIYNADHYKLIDTIGLEKFFNVSEQIITFSKCNFFILMYDNSNEYSFETETLKYWINTVKNIREENVCLNTKVICHVFILGNNTSGNAFNPIKEKMDDLNACVENANISIHDAGLVNMNGETMEENKENVEEKFKEINDIFKENLNEDTILENEKNFKEAFKKRSKKVNSKEDGKYNYYNCSIF